MSRSGLLIVMLLGACARSGTWAVVTVSGNLAAVDQLHVIVQYDDGHTQEGDALSSPRPLTLPVQLDAQFPDQTATVTFVIVALAYGTAVGQGQSAPVTLQPHRTVSASVGLSDGVALDGGLGGDLALGDGASPLDLGPSPDLLDPCPPAATLVCSGFEPGNSLPTYSLSLPGSISPETTRAYRGSYSLHAHSDPPSTYELGYWVFAPQTGTIGVREFVYTPALGTAAYVLQVRGTMDSWRYSIGYNTSGKLATQVDRGTCTCAANCDCPTTTAFPTGRWVCLESVVTPPAAAGTAGHMDVYVDGASTAAASFDYTPPPDGGGTSLDDVNIGIIDPGDVAYDFWIDDVAVGPGRIGCN